jgi:hypothetical protein
MTRHNYRVLASLKRAKIGCLALAIQALLCSPAFAGEALDLGVRLYNSGRYPDAVKILRQAAFLEPGNVRVHYYLANALLATGAKDQAMQEYGMCVWLEPNSDAAKYSRLALNQRLGVPSTLIATNPGSANVALQAGSAQVSDAVRPVTYTNEKVNNTMSVIRRQAHYEKEKQRRVGEAGAAQMSLISDVQAGRIEEEARSEIARVLTPPVIPQAYIAPGVRLFGPPPMWDPAVARRQADQIRQSADETKKKIQARANASALIYKQLSEQRQKSLDQVVASVEGLLSESRSPSGVKLNPVGTDLYVRYYGDGKGVKHSANQLANGRGVEKLVGSKASQGVLHHDGYAFDPPRVIKTVTGKIMD